MDGIRPFPAWMWRNQEVREFVDWLRSYNTGAKPDDRVAFYGLDLYSLYNSIQSVLDYLDRVDPKTAAVARQRYACLTPWQSDPAVYGHATLTGQYRTCEPEVTSMLADLMQRRRAYAEHDGARFLDAVQNARLVANAERYYRTMYYGSRESWNLRDSHMFETLKNLLSFHGPHSKGLVWAHNSHVGDSSATEMSARDEYNIGHLCRQEFGNASYSIGFGTHGGTVAAASNWDEPMQIKTIRPAGCPGAMRGYSTRPANQLSYFPCERFRARCPRDYCNPGSNVRSGSFTGRKPNCKAITLKQSYRGNSMSTFGSMRRTRSPRCAARNLRTSQIPIPSGCERRHAGLQEHSLCSRQAELDAR